MFKKIKAWFSKDQEQRHVVLPKDSEAKFTLMIDDIVVGYLHAHAGEWSFEYSEQFKKQHDYKLITGFSEVNKIYKSDELWPFFQIRIPGLKQPAIIETLEKENIDKNDEVQLLKRFGKRTIANPYELIVA